MSYNWKPSRYYDPREELDPTYQLALGLMVSDDAPEAFWRTVFSTDFITTPSEFHKQLNQTTRDSLELWVASVGGYLQAATQIVAALQDSLNKGQHLLVKNVAYAASAATLPFVLLQSRRGQGRLTREVSPTASFMIHAPQVILTAPSDQMDSQALEAYATEIQQIASFNRRQREELADLYVQGTSLSHEQVVSYMDSEHTFTASEALEAGFVDQIAQTSAYQPERTATEETNPADPALDDLSRLYSLVAFDQMQAQPVQSIASSLSQQALSTPKVPSQERPPMTPLFTPEEESRIRQALALDDQVEVNAQHALQVADQAENKRNEVLLEREAQAQVALKERIDGHLNPYFEANVITAAKRDSFARDIMAHPDPQKQLDSVCSVLDQALPAAPNESKDDPARQRLPGAPGSDPEDTPTDVQRCDTLFEKAIASGYSYGEAHSIVCRTIEGEHSGDLKKARAVLAEWETADRVRIDPGPSVRANVGNMQKLDKNKELLKQERIYI